MKKLCNTLALAGAGVLATLGSLNATAAGTSAGSVITNTATVTYSVASSQHTKSDSINLTVDEVINVDITSTGNTDVTANENNAVLAYQVTNLGNGSEDFSFTNALSGDFNPTSVTVYYEPFNAGGNTFDGTETTYTPGSSLTFSEDQSYVVYVVSNIPSTPASGDSATVTIEAVSQTPGASSAALGDILAGEGTSGSDAVVAIAQGRDSDAGNYNVNDVSVTIDKTIAGVTANVGGQVVNGQYIPGATVTYLITVVVTGGTAESLSIIDTVPTDMTYVANTIEKDDNTTTFAAEPDTAYDSLNRTVSVPFGNKADGTYRIRFNATIN